MMEVSSGVLPLFAAATVNLTPCHSGAPSEIPREWRNSVSLGGAKSGGCTGLRGSGFRSGSGSGLGQFL